MTLSRLRPFVLTVFAVAAVSACAEFDGTWPDSRPTIGQPAERFEPPPPRPARATVVTRQAKPADRKVEVAAPVAKPDTLKLVGLSEAETADLLGHPAEENEDPPGKVWVYKANGCRLSVHLYPDMEQGGFYALDYKADEGGRDACLGKLATAKRKE